MKHAEDQERGRAPLGEDEVKTLAEWMRADGDDAVLEATGLSRQISTGKPHARIPGGKAERPRYPTYAG